LNPALFHIKGHILVLYYTFKYYYYYGDKTPYCQANIFQLAKHIIAGILGNSCTGLLEFKTSNSRRNLYMDGFYNGGSAPSTSGSPLPSPWILYGLKKTNWQPERNTVQV